MLDINFYMQFDRVMEQIGKISDKKMLMDELEKIRSADPVVYNIETTNS